MFKNRKKKQQAFNKSIENKGDITLTNTIEKASLLDDVHLLTQDFRSSVIIPQLNKNVKSSNLKIKTNLITKHTVECDGSKQYQDLAAWRHQRSQHRYSNGLFGGKQRNRPKIATSRQRQFAENNADIADSSNINEESTKDSEEEDEKEEEEDQVAYHPESDTEENFFFQDFSTKNSEKMTTNRRHKLNSSDHSTKVTDKFNLSSFAQDLHDHRLSVIQPRQSRIIMTEDDELELEKLLKQQRQRMSTMTINALDESTIPPPLPPFDLLQAHQKIEKYSPLNSNTTNNTTDNSSSRYSSSSSSGSSNSEHYNHELSIIEEDSNKIALNSEDEFNVPQDSASLNYHKSTSYKPVKPTRSISSFTTTKKATSQTTIERSTSTTIHPTSSRKKDESIKNTRIQRQQKARKSMSMDDINLKLQDKQKDIELPSTGRSSLSKEDDNITSWAISENESIKISKKKLSTCKASSSPPITSKPRGLLGSLRQVSRSKSHHAGHGVHQSLKGLVRNFSTKSSSSTTNTNLDRDSSSVGNGMSRAAMAVIQHNVDKQEQKNKKPASVIPEETQSPSHHLSPKPENTNGASTGIARLLITQFLARASSANSKKKRRNNQGAKITNMEEEDSCCINKAAQDKRDKRAQVVRRTIIYVQPDYSLQELLSKNEEVRPKLPSPTTSNKLIAQPDENNCSTLSSQSSNNDLNRRTALSDGSSLSSPEDEIIRQSKEYVLATKVSRQTSVRKKVVKEEENHELMKDQLSTATGVQGAPRSNGSITRRKKWKLESMGEEIHDEKLMLDNEDKNYLEGLELREMSDGSVVWGIVKKQGNRKSFYAPNQKNEYEYVDDEVEEEEVCYDQNMRFIELEKQSQKALSPLLLNSSLSTPPPIPKRSPRRRSPSSVTANYDSVFGKKEHNSGTTTDIYYSDQVSLPNLLKIMQGHEQSYPSEKDEYAFNEKAMSSVDDQLDEMMRILTSQQQ
ncbi:MAG: hypothetical protein EXX96DRAFT_654709 [Benjaminiella poitrasii]|nr:MAG: hypothetical protein EXX96DRAFT_654709 [Benjaminiella poitrasii]